MTTRPPGLRSDPTASVPTELGGIPVVAACLPEDYRRLGDNEGMWGPARFQSFDSLAVCVDENSGGIFVFKCIGTWSVLADEWYETKQQSLDVLEHQYPGITGVLVVAHRPPPAESLHGNDNRTPLLRRSDQPTNVPSHDGHPGGNAPE
jgi:hypothetical protein